MDPFGAFGRVTLKPIAETLDQVGLIRWLVLIRLFRRCVFDDLAVGSVMGWSIGPCVGRLAGRSVRRSVGRSPGRSARNSAVRCVGRSVGPSLGGFDCLLVGSLVVPFVSLFAVPLVVPWVGPLFSSCPLVGPFNGGAGTAKIAVEIGGNTFFCTWTKTFYRQTLIYSPLLIAHLRTTSLSYLFGDNPCTSASRLLYYPTTHAAALNPSPRLPPPPLPPTPSSAPTFTPLPPWACVSSSPYRPLHACDSVRVDRSLGNWKAVLRARGAPRGLMVRGIS